jgi:hypothetical protein
MQVNDAYEVLGVNHDASKEEINKAYFDLASTCLNDKSNDKFLSLSRAFVSLSESKSLMVYRPDRQTNEKKKEPKANFSLAGKLWEKKLSLTSVLGLAMMGGMGIFVGFSFQPKTMVIREIVREASAPSESVALDKKVAVSDIPSKSNPLEGSASPDKLTANRAVKKEDTDGIKKAAASQKNVTQPGGASGADVREARLLERSRKFAGVVPPSIGSQVYVPPAGKVPMRELIQPLPPVPEIPAPRPMNPVGVRNPASNTAPVPIQVPQVRKDNSDKTLSVVKAPPTPVPQKNEQVEPFAPKDRTLSAEPRVSAVDVLSTIDIPLEGGGTVKANTLLEADTKVWKAKKGITRQKFNTLIAALVESKNLTLSAQKASLSLKDIQSLVQTPAQEEKTSDN